MESIFWNLLEIFINFYQSSLETYFVYNFLSPKKGENHRTGFLLCSAAIGSIQTLSDYFLPVDAVSALCHVAVLFLYSMKKLNGGIGKKLFACVLPPLLITLIAMFILPFHYFFKMLDITPPTAGTDSTVREIIMIPNATRLLSLVLVQILVYVGFNLSLKFYKSIIGGGKEKKKINIVEWGTSLFLFVIFSFVMLSIQKLIQNTQNKAAQQQLFLFIIIIILICILIITLLYILGKYYRRKLELDTIEQNKLYIRHEMKLMQQAQLKIDCLRHDMKNHFLQIEILAKNGNTEEILKYTATGRKNLTADNQYISTGNKNIDCMLNFKLDMARDENIALTTHASLPEQLNIASFDLNTILGNLLDNALEALEKSSEKKLDISIKYNKNILIIKIGNSFNGTVKKNLKTTKANPAKHGLGLKSVQMVVKKHNGCIQYDCGQEYFVTKVLLYNE